ncbi:hypothetical protein DFH28DRAFT_1126847 [Melampsora americana]|nr:hypothetical protein DFH28DRAFT_1126847 [Melampsora americana]
MSFTQYTIPSLPRMGDRIPPKICTAKADVERRPHLITKGMSARKQSEMACIPMPLSAMPEVKAGKDQCFRCNNFGHILFDCNERGSLRPEPKPRWRRVDNGKLYSVYAFWPSVRDEDLFDLALVESSLWDTFKSLQSP